ncbi:uncharacterized protein LOC131644867 isoform X2 [Vicia villosa]|uniref:uncharacterized protein LOC131644867 isoform X2 n=1 Tax=Vicia villosa TaxID=3911 RepID=UPI00273AFA51|nr:uncharacterized protein LOC131644867 isoform X2 [Vicia villosa]
MISKRGINGMEVPKKRTGLVFRETATATANTRDDKNRARAGCSNAPNPPVQKRSSEKAKVLRPSTLSSSSRKEVVGSSRSRRTYANPVKPLNEPRRILSSGGLPAEEKGRECTNVIRTAVGKSGAVSNLRSQRNFNQRPGLRQRETESIGPATRAVSSKYGLRNLRCSTLTDAIPSSCSSSDSSSTLNRSKTIVTKMRSSGGESSSTLKGKKVTGSSLERLNSGTRNGRPSSDTRGSRNIPPLRDNSRASVRTERTVSGYARGRFSNQGNENSKENNGGNSRASVKTERTVSGYGRGRFSKQGNENSKEKNESRDVLPNSPHSIDINSPVTEEFRGVMPMSHEEHGTRHSLIIQDGFRRRHNMDGISEVLLALERMEQNEELTHEQIDLLETNSLLDGLSFYDTHRDMRLDIDDMSYEELLALEERMGTVSTALSEEALSNSLKKSVYESTPSDDAADCVDEDNNEIKCCICQEEYVVGDEIGRLQCTHKYHVDCIQEWLRLKNWCPMCKESAALSNSSSSSSH